MQQLRHRIHEVIFEAETPAGKFFDIALLWTILLSLLVVTLESVPEYRVEYGVWFDRVEWVLTILFTIEYCLRIFCVHQPLKYIFSFYGIVDLLATAPAYLSLFFSGAQSLLVIRSLRLLRVFRLFKLGRYLGEADVIADALRASRVKITVFLVAVLSLVMIMGTVMYLVEGEEHGFTSIPKSVYWAIVTVTTVGYGDIAPQTSFGQFLASIMMIMGYGIIAVPTGIVSAEMVTFGQMRRTHNTITCEHCCLEGHAKDAKHCRGCGAKLE